jgi:hypothetical protein
MMNSAGMGTHAGNNQKKYVMKKVRMRKEEIGCLEMNDFMVVAFFFQATSPGPNEGDVEPWR